MTATPLSARPRAYVARRLTPAVEQTIAARYQTAFNEADEVLSSAALTAAAAGSSYLFVTVTERVTAEMISELSPDLRVIATLSVGVDHIDLPAARAAGIAVINTPDVLSEACAEVALLLMLNACRRGYEADAMVRSGQWIGWAPTQLLGLGLAGRRLGILGLGRIGRQVALRAAGFGMSIHYHTRRRVDPELEAGAQYHETAEALLRHSDVFCICAPGGAELSGFLDAGRIALLPPNAVVVNISRGDIVDDDALIEALQSRRLFAAGLDVFRGEPALDPRYCALPNVFLTPHIGSATAQTRDAMGFLLVDGIRAFEEGATTPNRLC